MGGGMAGYRRAIGGWRSHCRPPVSYRWEVSGSLCPQLSKGDRGSLADVNLGLNKQREEQRKLGG